MIKIADKFRRTFPIAVNFSDGELPTAKKLNGLANQARSSTGLLEYAIGDIWNQAGDGVLGQSDDSVILTPSLGRALGGMRKISPRIPALPNIEEYTYVAFDDVDGYQSIQLPFRPVVGSTFSFTGVWGGNDATPKAAKRLVVESGNWYVNYETGYLYTFDQVNSGDTLTYVPVVPGDMMADGTANLIPDEDTYSGYAFQGLKIEFTNGSNSDDGYDIYLPPRGPLNTRANDLARPPSSEGTEASTTENYQVAPLATNPRRFWQADTEDADTSANAAHYRYELPKILTDNWSSGAVIPAGFMYLYDPNSRTILEGVAMTAEAAGTPKTWFFHASGTALDNWLATATGTAKYPTAALQSSGHGASLYPALGLKVLCIGTSVADTLNALLLQFLNHNHGDDNYNLDSVITSRSIKHSDLLSLDSPDQRTPQLPFSAWSGDDHNQYVHRWGMSSGRDKYYGGMFGDLLFLSVNSGSDYQNLLDSSKGIRFGDGVNGPYLRYDINGANLNLGFPSSDVDGFTLAHSGLSPNPKFKIHFPLDAKVATELETTNGSLQLVRTNSANYDSYARLDCDTSGSFSTAGDSFFIIGNKNTDDSDAAGQNGSIVANRQFAGPYNDTTIGPYGWSVSGGATNAFYGPIRYHSLAMFDFMMLATHANFSATATAYPEVDARNFWQYGFANMPLPIFEFAAASGTSENMAYIKIDLPYQKWCVVNAHIRFSNQSNPLPDNTCYLGIGKGNLGTASFNEIDLYDVFGSAADSGAVAQGNCFSVSDTTPLKEYTASESDSSLAFLRLRSVGNISPATLAIQSITIHYRVWEF